ncbi:MAG: hypothetical protein ACFBRM_16415 [Pikeienuella sp.]
MAIRAIADPAGEDLPSFVAEAVGPDGRPKLGVVLSGLARNPAALPGLLRLSRAYRQGLDALADCAESDALARLIAAVPRI